MKYSQEISRCGEHCFGRYARKVRLRTFVCSVKFRGLSSDSTIASSSTFLGNKRQGLPLFNTRHCGAVTDIARHGSNRHQNQTINACHASVFQKTEQLDMSPCRDWWQGQSLHTEFTGILWYPEGHTKSNFPSHLREGREGIKTPPSLTRDTPVIF